MVEISKQVFKELKPQDESDRSDSSVSPRHVETDEERIIREMDEATAR